MRAPGLNLERPSERLSDALRPSEVITEEMAHVAKRENLPESLIMRRCQGPHDHSSEH